MDERIYIDGDTIFLKIKRTDDATFRTVACTQTNGFSINPSPAKRNNKCSGPWDVNRKGTAGWQFDWAGDAIDITEGGDPLPSELSYAILVALAVSQEKFEAIMTNADGSYYRGGTVMVSAYKEDGNNGEELQFSGTLLGIGEPVVVKPEA